MKNKEIKVIGDIMIDEWIYGDLDKKSAEGNLKIFENIKSETSLGGVGFLSSNLKNLNINFKLFCKISNDDFGRKTIEKLKKKRINFDFVKNKMNTIVKKRFFCKNKQIFRCDEEKLNNEKDIGIKFLSNLNKGDTVIISDYKKGSIYKKLHETIIKKKCTTFVDPKNDPSFYKNAFLVKPNMPKFKEWCGGFSNKKAFTLIKKMGWSWLIISNSDSGVYVYNKLGQKRFFKVKKINNPNVIGAGDIFFSGLIYFHLKNYDIFTAAELSSYAASKCVSKKFMREVHLKDFKKDIIFTNGVFDILHRGHLDLLKFAKRNCRKLIVGINSDSSVKLNKGKSRPYNSLKKRISKLRKTKLIDQILVFKDKTPIKLINKIKPDAIIKGSDYKQNQVVGKKISNIIIFEKKNNLSSTRILNKMRNGS